MSWMGDDSRIITGSACFVGEEGSLPNVSLHHSVPIMGELQWGGNFSRACEQHKVENGWISKHLFCHPSSWLSSCGGRGTPLPWTGGRNLHGRPRGLGARRAHAREKRRLRYFRSTRTRSFPPPEGLKSMEPYG